MRQCRLKLINPPLRPADICPFPASTVSISTPSREKEPRRGPQEALRPQQLRPHHRPPPGRRQPQKVPHHRLQARQAGRAGYRPAPGVRSEPQRLHRPGRVRRRRAPLHPGPCRPERRRHRSVLRRGADIKPGNALPLANIPVGTVIHNIELYPGKGAQLVRSAGVAAQLMAKEGGYGYRSVSPPASTARSASTAWPCIGQVGNVDHANIAIGKAGRKRHMGIRPTVRGSVMNPCDHPHGGGEGKSACRPSRPGHPVGQAGAGLQDPQDEEPRPTSSLSSAATRSKEGIGK